jgi:hypothetical protein
MHGFFVNESTILFLCQVYLRYNVHDFVKHIYFLHATEETARIQSISSTVVSMKKRKLHMK